MSQQHLDIESNMEQSNMEQQGNMDGQSKASELKDKAGELKEKAGEKAAELKEKASETMHQLSGKAHEMASDLHEKTDRSLHSLGEKMTRVAGTAREKGLTTVADRLESGGQFLTENGVNELSEKATGLIRQHPVESMVVGLGIGILLGSLLSARRERS